MVQQKSDDKPDEPGLQLFTLAYNPVTDTATFQTDMPIPQVLGLIQKIMFGQERMQGRAEALAELAKQEEGDKKPAEQKPEGEKNG